MWTDPAATGNVELLLNGRFPDHWTPIGPGGEWEMNPAGELIQKSLVGSTRGGTGAILAHKTAISAPVVQLALACRPGTQYQVGIVFNLVDAHNFCAFCIDRHTRKSASYDLLAFEVNAGDYHAISKRSFKGTLPEAVGFTLTQMGSNLALFFNDTLVHFWPDMFLFGKRVGVYSQRNQDAEFLSLSVTPPLHPLANRNPPSCRLQRRTRSRAHRPSSQRNNQ